MAAAHAELGRRGARSRASRPTARGRARREDIAELQAGEPTPRSRWRERRPSLRGLRERPRGRAVLAAPRAARGTQPLYGRGGNGRGILGALAAVARELAPLPSSTPHVATRRESERGSEGRSKRKWREIFSRALRARHPGRFRPPGRDQERPVSCCSGSAPQDGGASPEPSPKREVRGRESTSWLVRRGAMERPQGARLKARRTPAYARGRRGSFRLAPQGRRRLEKKVGATLRELGFAGGPPTGRRRGARVGASGRFRSASCSSRTPAIRRACIAKIRGRAGALARHDRRQASARRAGSRWLTYVFGRGRTARHRRRRPPDGRAPSSRDRGRETGDRIIHAPAEVAAFADATCAVTKARRAGCRRRGRHRGVSEGGRARTASTRAHAGGREKPRRTRRRHTPPMMLRRARSGEPAGARGAGADAAGDPADCRAARPVRRAETFRDSPDEIARRKMIWDRARC